MTAVVSAGICYRKGNAVIILSGNAVRPDLVGVTVFFPDKIVGHTITIFFFLHRWNYLLPYRTIEIIRIHKGSKVWCGSPFCIQGCYGIFFFRADIDKLS